MATMILAPAIAAEPSPSGNSGSIGFFAALDQKLIEAKIVPRDAKEVVIQITNKTDRPLAIQRPDAFVAAAILAQNFGQNNNFPNNRNATNSNKVPQTLGASLTGNGVNNNRLGNGFNGMGNGLNANPLFNIPPEKTLRFTAPCVCLEHGKPNPTPAYPYEIRPLESFSDRSEIREIVSGLSAGRYSQRVAQIAAWHFSDGLGWEGLAKLEIRHLNGQRSLEFTAREIESAKQMVAGLSTSKQPRSVVSQATGGTQRH